MRIGENPTKFLRHNPSFGKLDIKTPLPLTACTVTYVPKLAGYYEQGLDILKMVLGSIRENTTVPFDLMVFDNGSCPEVIDYLLELKNNDVIQWLCLSSKNMKKLGAWNHLFSAALGELIYYFDSDIYHYPGWFDDAVNILNNFKQAGLVCSYPLPPSKIHNSDILIEIEKSPDTTLEKGYFISEKQLQTLAESLGAEVENYINKKTRTEQIRINCNGINFFVSAWHAQFLVRGEIVKQIFPMPGDWALNATDKSFDKMIENMGYLRVSTVKAGVYHLGNILTDKWKPELEKYNISRNTSNRNNKLRLKIILRFKPVYWILLRLYALLYRLVYAV
jgi:glycosyltransferase involved in cell wall biosynthesis